MDSRRAAAAVFVALCLGLCGLVLHRQIAAHPPPLEADLSNERAIDVYAHEYGRSIDKKTWHVAEWPRRRQVLFTIQKQLSALRNSDTDTAISYQTRSSRNHLRSATGLARTIFYFYPKIDHARGMQFGTLWMDPTEQFADVTMTARGANGRLVRGDYQLLLEDGAYRVASVQEGRATQ